MSDDRCANGCVCEYVITDPLGNILARFSDEIERDEAMYTGEFPDDSEPAFINDDIV